MFNLPEIILIVFDITSSTTPANVFTLGIDFGVKHGLHAHIVEAVRFEEITYGKSILNAWFRVFHLKVIPLSVFCCVEIISQVEVIFGFASLEN